MARINFYCADLSRRLALCSSLRAAARLLACTPSAEGVPTELLGQIKERYINPPKRNNWRWQGWLDSNQRLTASKAVALPLGDTPVWGSKTGLGYFPIPLFVGWVKGLEPSTPGTTIRCSNQLSYTHHRENGTPEGTRTPGLLLRRQLLYPAELLAHICGPSHRQLLRRPLRAACAVAPGTPSAEGVSS